MTERVQVPETRDGEQVAREYFRLWLHEQRERKRLETEMRLVIATLSSVQALRRPTHNDMIERIRAAIALLKTSLEQGKA